MDQDQLHALERLCTQEEPPPCRAACPLHVDVRMFTAHVACGLWDKAWTVLRTTMPFPGIIARLCDEPCTAECVRAGLGGAIRIRELERACVRHAPPPHRVMPLPPRDKRAAVIGVGLAGLTAAWDLARKGYPVTLFASKPTLAEAVRAHLADRLPDLVPDEVVEPELTPLNKLGATYRQTADIDDATFPETLRSEFDTVFLSSDAVRSGTPPTCSPMTRETDKEGIFCGGSAESPIFRAAEGRAAATSMDRAMQNVSLTARRTGEGPYRTRLHVETRGIRAHPPVHMSAPDEGYTDEEAALEAGRCLQCECMECVKACVFLQKYKGYPKTYARRIYNNESIVKGHRQANRMINSCMLCGQCEVLCPNGFPMAELCLNTRRSMVRRSTMPPSAHDFALKDLKFNRSRHFALSRHAPGQTESTAVFFPGCQLAGSSPELTEKTYAWLRSEHHPQTGLRLGCCGAPALWAGRDELFREVLNELRDDVRRMGNPLLITACSTCASVFAQHSPDLKFIPLWRIMSGHDLGTSDRTAPLALHDPCTARNDIETQDAVRSIAAGLGLRIEELPLNRKQTSCCGYGGLLYNADPKTAREVAAHRAAESEHDFLVWCAMCRDNIAGAGKRALHLLDVILCPSNDTGHDPADRPNPGFSARCENRARLRKTLLKNLWNEESDDMDAHASITLELSPDIRALCEERLILDDDLKQVILHAEQTGRKMHNPKNGRYLAYHQPVRVTYWVEYEKSNDREETYRIHNAYTHRMTVPGGEE